jgi:hypothetical protein
LDRLESRKSLISRPDSRLLVKAWAFITSSRDMPSISRDMVTVPTEARESQALRKMEEKASRQ